MVLKRIISAVTSIAVLASTATVLSGCGSLDEFFNGESKKETENSSEANNTVAKSTEDGVITNGEWLAMVNDAFGMQVDESAEDGEIEAAKEWGVIGEDENIDMESPVDDKFVTTTLMRAAGYSDLNSSDEEVIQAAIDHGVISSPDASVSSPEQAIESLSTAQHEWSNQTFEECYDIELADNVTNLTESLSVTDVEISDGSLILPTESVQNLANDSVVIVPQENDEDGVAYKVVSVKNGADGKSEVRCVPATFEEVYKDINVSGVFGKISNVEPAEGVSYEFVDSDAGIAPLSYAGEGEIQPLIDIKREGTTEVKDLVFKKKVGAVELEAGVKDISITTKIDCSVLPKSIRQIYLAVDYTEYVSASTGFVFGTDEDGNTNIFNLDKKVDEASLDLGEIDIHVCSGIAIALKASLSFNATGEAKVELSIANTKGIEMRGDCTPRCINENSRKAEVAINGKLGAYANLTLALVPSFLTDIELLRITLKIGPTLQAEMTWDSDVKIACAQVDGWLTIELSVGLLESFFKNSHVTLLTIDDKDSSPVTFEIHLENFEIVPECTVTGEKTTEATTEAPTIPTGIFSIAKSYMSINVGSSAKLAVESLPSGYSAEDVIWESSNPAVASVDASGNISANSSGTANITVKTTDGKYSASCAVSATGAIVANKNISPEIRNYSNLIAA